MYQRLISKGIPTLGILIASICIFIGCSAANIPSEIMKFNPRLKDTGSAEAAKWQIVDLSKVANAPLLGTLSYGIDAADFDNDGDMDIILVFQSNKGTVTGITKDRGMIYWLENITAGPKAPLKFHAHVIDDKQITPKDAIVFESPKSKKKSIIIPSYLSGETILYQTYTGKKWNKIKLDSKSLKATVRMVVADIDNNSTDDIVVSSIADQGEHLTWFRQTTKTPTGWEEVPIHVELPPLVGVDAGDVDGDGDLDLVCGSEHAPAPNMLINLDGKGTKWEKRPIEVRSKLSMFTWVASFSKKVPSQNHAKFVDIDGDGDLDCVETSLKNGYVAWRENLGKAKQWKFHPIAGKMGTVYYFELGDVDKDGTTDIVAASDGGDGVYIFYNINKGKDWKVTRLGDGTGMDWPNIVRLADINGDGRLDILATDFGSKPTAWINPSPAK